jgi:hypothetical protein
MHKRFLLKAATAATLALGLALPPSPSSGNRHKPINLIVPWAAGGSTDQITRVTAAELEKVLDQKIVVVNQPGASGSIGTKNALGSSQGRLHLGGRRGPGSGHLPVAGHRSMWRITDWHLFLNCRQHPGGRCQREERPTRTCQGVARCHEGQAR